MLSDAWLLSFRHFNLSKYGKNVTNFQVATAQPPIIILGQTRCQSTQLGEANKTTEPKLSNYKRKIVALPKLPSFQCGCLCLLVIVAYDAFASLHLVNT